jgi:zinc/manganese transport system permease protein
MNLQQSLWWFYPLLMCLVLTGIHGYLGIHVLKRKVIFVDLAMAQIAALGSAYGVLLGYDPREPADAVPLYLFSLGFTLAGAAVIAVTRMRHERVPHEALIGIVYASASALALLVLSKAAGEAEQIKHMLVGNLLVVTPAKVGVTAAIYAAIGVGHYIYRDRFLKISEDPEGAEREGIRVRFWDFLFYVSFGVVITSSVSIAGVLLVFSYLVVPGVIAILYAEGVRERVLLAWGVGTLVSVLGMAASSAGDLPTGPTIVAAFAAALAGAGAVHYVRSRTPRGAAVARLAGVAAGIVLVLWGSSFLRKSDDHVHHEDEYTRLVEALASDDPARVIDAIDHLADLKDPHAVEPLVRTLRAARHDLVLEHVAHALAKIGRPEGAPALRDAAARPELDPALRLDLARSILDLRDPAGLDILIRVLEENPPEAVRREALELFRERTGLPTGSGTPEELRRWWARRGASLRWREETRRFE